MITRADIVDMARTQLGVRWQHQARLRGVALDCFGLIIVVALSLGTDGAEECASDERFKSYGRSPDHELLNEACAILFNRIDVSAAEPGDVLTFAFPNNPQHFAIVSDIYPLRVIHAYAQRRRVCENGLPIINSRITAAYAFRGMT